MSEAPRHLLLGPVHAAEGQCPGQFTEFRRYTYHGGFATGCRATLESGPSTHVIASVAPLPQLVATIDGDLMGTH